jgi:hypothetical protein
MLWIMMLFAVGICGTLGFYDKLLGFSDQMRYLNSGILVLLSVGLLIRTWVMIRSGKKEKLMERNSELEKMLEQSGQKNTREEHEIAASHIE